MQIYVPTEKRNYAQPPLHSITGIEITHLTYARRRMHQHNRIREKNGPDQVEDNF